MEEGAKSGEIEIFVRGKGNREPREGRGEGRAAGSQRKRGVKCRGR